MVRDTPIENYKINGHGVFVKREDLACKPPGPPFAKVRGLYPVLLKLRDSGVSTVGYMDTSISMAGWGVSYFCQQLGLRAVIFMPVYKDGYRHNQESHLWKWQQFGADVIRLTEPNRMQINFYRAKRVLQGKYPAAYMLPLGLTFSETVGEVSRQFELVPDDLLDGSVVTCVGSGAMLAGILRGGSVRGSNADYYGVLVSMKGGDRMREKVIGMAGLLDGGFFGSSLNLNVVDYGYNYTDIEEAACPFPCNRFYDRKAWKWLLDSLDNLKEPILFWNIGGGK